LAFEEFSPALQSVGSEKLSTRGPPDISRGITLFLKNCTFRI
jgi:hypothetical protein